VSDAIPLFLGEVHRSGAFRDFRKNPGFLWIIPDEREGNRAMKIPWVKKPGTGGVVICGIPVCALLVGSGVRDIISKSRQSGDSGTSAGEQKAALWTGKSGDPKLPAGFLSSGVV
jgi:hypothetical protein